MNTKHLLFLLFLFSTMHIAAADVSRARVFAFDLQTEFIDEHFYATFQSNTPFTEGYVYLYPPTTEPITSSHTPAITIPITSDMVDGSHVRVPIPEHLMTGEYAGMLDVLNWAVQLTGTPIAETPELVEFTDPTAENITFYLPQGVAINTNPYSSYFGDIYIAQAADGRTSDGDGAKEDWYDAGKNARTQAQKKGIFVYNPLFEEKNPTNQGYLPANIAWRDMWRHDMHRIAINPTNDHVAFAYWHNQDGKNTTTIYEVHPRHLRGDAHAFDAIDVAPDSPLKRAHSLCYDHTGTLFVLDTANVNASGNKASGLLYKKSGDDWQLIVNGINEGNTDAQGNVVGLWAGLDNALASDGQGGLWVAQYRENFLKKNQEGTKQLDLYPILAHVSATNQIDFMVTQKSHEDLIRMFTRGSIDDGTGVSNRGQLAYWQSENLLAYAGNGRVTLYRTAYDADGKPTLTPWLSTPEIAYDIDGIAFDYVGNLYVLSHTTQRLYAFALPKADNTSFVPAPRKVITIDQDKDNTTSDAMNFYRTLPANSAVDVKLIRPFTNQYWQTLTLPFAMTSEQTQAVFGDRTDVAIMAHSYLMADDCMYLRFDFTESVPQGQPCLVHPSENLARGAVVKDVVLSTDVQAVHTGKAHMYGILAPMDFNAFRDEHPDEYFYFLAPNQLLAKNAAQTMQALRAYFQFALSKEQLQRLSAKVVFEDEMPTDIEHIPEPMQPLPPAKILRDGQLIIRHNGMEFTPLGQRVR